MPKQDHIASRDLSHTVSGARAEGGAFKLDTSGEVSLSVAQGVPFEVAGGYEWPDLTPFTQGYVEALFKALDLELPHLRQEASAQGAFGTVWPFRFSDLSPEALAMILRDCEAFQRQHFLGDKITGGQFWAKRQVGNFGPFPPLTVTLADDGKVHLAECA